MFRVHYQPPGAWFGDCMPFYEDGSFYLFHQRDTRRPGPFGEPFGWALVQTTDFLNFRDLGEVIPGGGEEARDQFVFAGSVFAAEGSHHAIYTGFNRDFAERGRPSQVLMWATSPDLEHWTKADDFQLSPPPGYDTADWRDPYVFRDEEQGRYVMILGGRLEGPRNLTGRTVHLSSTDLESWAFEGDLWAPDLYSMHEMPDLFQLGDAWYLLTTEYSDRSKTVYRRGPSWRGPWSAPVDDAFDGRAYYAARSASDGTHRYLFGWVPTKEGDDDLGDWQWGGTLMVHEVQARADGSLGVAIPDPVRGAFARRLAIREEPVRLVTAGARVERSLVGALEDTFLLEATLSFAPGTRKVGIRLFVSETTGEGYEFSLRPLEKRLTFDRSGTYKWNRHNDKGLERPLDLAPGVAHRLQLLVDDTVATLYVDGVALTARLYAKAGRGLTLDVVDGAGEVGAAALHAR